MGWGKQIPLYQIEQHGGQKLSWYRIQVMIVWRASAIVVSNTDDEAVV